MTEPRELVFLTIAEYAKTRKVSESTVRRQIKAGQLPVERISSRCVRIRLSRRVTNSQGPSPAPRA